MSASGHGQDEKARLQTYPFKLYYPACFSFYHHMHGSKMGSLKVFLDDNLVWQLWVLKVINGKLQLSQYLNQVCTGCMGAVSACLVSLATM